MKRIEVGCAIIRKAGKILIAQRKPESHLGGYWEFPGGKRDGEETIEACLIREVEEELGVIIKPMKFLQQIEHPYPDRSVTLFFYLCDWTKGEPEKRDCHDFKWVKSEELKNFLFPPADAEMIRELIEKRQSYFS